MTTTPPPPAIKLEPADVLLIAEPRLAEYFSRAELDERATTLAAQLLSAGRLDHQARTES